MQVKIDIFLQDVTILFSPTMCEIYFIRNLSLKQVLLKVTNKVRFYFLQMFFD